MLIDLRARHHAIGRSVHYYAARIAVGHGLVFAFSCLTGYLFTAAFAIAALCLTGIPLLVTVIVDATIRPIIARPEGLEVQGELVPWKCVSEPKTAFFSLGARAWITVQAQDWNRDLMILAKPEDIDRIARMRTARTDLRPKLAVSAYRGMTP